MRIADTDDKEVPRGERGEIQIRGPGVFTGYWRRPEATEAAFTHDGWFRTGDVATMDAAGYVFVVDRTKDMYISGGENVYPAEVEAAIAEMSDVSEVAVIGVPDVRWGEVGRAYVAPARGVTLTAQAVLDHCDGRLARYKVPKTVVVVDALPRNGAGKVVKTELRAQAAETLN
jgi:fatty-acyl-CoA synthase